MGAALHPTGGRPAARTRAGARREPGRHRRVLRRRTEVRVASMAWGRRGRSSPDRDALTICRPAQPRGRGVQTAIRYAGCCSTRAPAARIAASARSPSPGCRSTITLPSWVVAVPSCPCWPRPGPRDPWASSTTCLSGRAGDVTALPAVCPRRTFAGSYPRRPTGPAAPRRPWGPSGWREPARHPQASGASPDLLACSPCPRPPLGIRSSHRSSTRHRPGGVGLHDQPEGTGPG